MNLFDIIILGVLAVAVVIAVITIRRNKKKGKSLSCGGDCSRCAGCSYHNKTSL